MVVVSTEKRSHMGQFLKDRYVAMKPARSTSCDAVVIFIQANHNSAFTTVRSQNFNFDNGFHREHIGASAYAYLDDLWMFGYVSEKAMYPMLLTLPDVVVHFAQSELNGAVNHGMIKRAGINTVHIPRVLLEHYG